jgi:1-acyl-sn-glycerol-3-phosphate acyltransferase
MIKKTLAKAFLRATGWRIDGDRPPYDKYVLVAAPHTSNWDGVYMIAIAWALEMRVRWVGKHTLFRFPYGPFMRLMGGVAVDRRASHNFVEAVVRLFAERDELCLAVPAEGTRSKVEYWKSGFYHMALSADVPLVLGFLDFSRKCGGFGPALRLTGDVRADMDRIRAFFADKKGKFPERFTPPRLRSEAEAAPAASGDAD